ncbi:hypothetical protein GQ607_000726 [Colletotrichum asianum]|uniref:Uncharacterized protein n=1 Tax=Colletotrichum asianum TaxID=702518 RepID=A0A8H3ZZF1_9PEZI|nr:hypothetical protein GQ607_000726 [Colletotrichum asianum]
MPMMKIEERSQGRKKQCPEICRGREALPLSRSLICRTKFLVLLSRASARAADRKQQEERPRRLGWKGNKKGFWLS